MGAARSLQQTAPHPARPPPTCLVLAACSTMSLKSCRQKLEDDMGLESGALKPFKQLLSDNIDKVPRTAGLRVGLVGGSTAAVCCCRPDLRLAHLSLPRGSLPLCSSLPSTGRLGLRRLGRPPPLRSQRGSSLLRMRSQQARARSSCASRSPPSPAARSPASGRSTRTSRPSNRVRGVASLLSAWLQSVPAWRRCCIIASCLWHCRKCPPLSGPDTSPAPPARSAAGPRQYSRKVEKLRSICKAATITIPPSLYVKNKGEDELAAALEALLEKHDLDINSGGCSAVRRAGRVACGGMGPSRQWQACLLETLVCIRHHALTSRSNFQLASLPRLPSLQVSARLVVPRCGCRPSVTWTESTAATLSQAGASDGAGPLPSSTRQ